MSTPENPLSGAELIAQERQRQIDEEGYRAEHDDYHNLGELTAAAVAYSVTAHSQINKEAIPDWPPASWPEWHVTYWRPADNPVRNLVKAGALIAAEIDRLQRARNRAGEEGRS